MLDWGISQLIVLRNAPVGLTCSAGYVRVLPSPVLGHHLSFDLALPDSGETHEAIFQRGRALGEVENVLLLQEDEVTIGDCFDCPLP